MRGASFNVTTGFTKTPRKLHGELHAKFWYWRYSDSVMQGAYVMQLNNGSSGEGLSGVVEEVYTGRIGRFQSGEELLEFLQRTAVQRGDSAQRATSSSGSQSQERHLGGAGGVAYMSYVGG